MNTAEKRAAVVAEALSWVIYVLKDPRNSAVRYVGWTVNFKTRIRDHIKPSQLEKKTRRDKWIKSLVDIGIKPLAEVIERGSGEGWAEAERRWIAQYRSSGAALTNLTDGGEGTTGFSHSELSRRQMSEKRKGRKPSPQSIAAIRAYWASHKKTPEHLERIRAATTGLRKSVSHRKALSIARTGLKLSDEARARLRASRQRNASERAR